PNAIDCRHWASRFAPAPTRSCPSRPSTSTIPTATRSRSRPGAADLLPTIVYRLQPWPAVDRLVFDSVPSGFSLVPMVRDASAAERRALLADADFLMGSWVTTTVK